jgi:hypothetical protein
MMKQAAFALFCAALFAADIGAADANPASDREIGEPLHAGGANPATTTPSFTLVRFILRAWDYRPQTRRPSAGSPVPPSRAIPMPC